MNKQLLQYELSTPTGVYYLSAESPEQAKDILVQALKDVYNEDMPAVTVKEVESVFEGLGADDDSTR